MASMRNQPATVTIPQDRWVEFLAEFTRQHRGAHARLEVINGEVGDQVETDGQPFDGIAADVKGSACAIWITFGVTTDDHLAHGIHQVKALRILPGGAGRGDVVEVESKDGTKTLLTLTPAEDFALPPGQRDKSEGKR